ncbi:hypothetical protein AB0K43_26825 [Kitasatospora sp. NPDC049258]|uniref:hypothetical protein n=1 Tax=Kitasatospora sp. NPDC049258 TaxID=3155394 RepID=UPI003429B791
MVGPDGTYRPGAQQRLRTRMAAADPAAFAPPDQNSEFEPGEPTWEMALRNVGDRLQ